jgi:hypothetical protein
MTYFITPEYMWNLSAEFLLVLGLALRLIVQFVNRAAAEKFARATAGIALALAGFLLWYNFPHAGAEVLSRHLSADVPGWIAKGLIVISAVAALRATMAHEQPQLFLCTVAAMLLAAANDLATAWLALECMLVAALARPGARLWSALLIATTAAFALRYGTTELSQLATLRADALQIPWLALPPVLLTVVFISYLYKPQGRYVAIVFFAILTFVVRYFSVIFAGTNIARKLGFLV